jgi:xylan 1,4-beta-xylosidase
MLGNEVPAIVRYRTCANFGRSIMCSYNALNGVPTCADPYILQTILREHWGWTNEDQYVTSDCDAIQNIYMPHNYSHTREGAVADALKAGTDLDCGTYYPMHLPAAYSEGLFDESVIDQALVRLYSALIKLGYFDSAATTPYRNLTFNDVSTPASEALALQAAEEGIVLLKNDGTLPLSLPIDKTTTFALIGGLANSTTQMQGNYYGTPPYLHSPLYAAEQLENVNVLYAAGVGGQGDPTTDDWQLALAAAEAADIIIVADGLSISDEAEGMDRYTIDWSAAQIDQLTGLAEMGKPTILLQMGDQLDNTPFLRNENVSAIVWGGYPGQDGGTALMNVVTGKVAPAGRLPVTQYPANYVRQVAMTDMSLRPNETSGNPGRTYRWFDGAVQEFGFGLHYTDFSLSLAKKVKESYDILSLLSACTERYKDLCPFATFDVNVTNTGNVASDFVTLGFIAGEYGPAPYPIKQLVSYQRVFGVAAGGSKVTSLNVNLGGLARYDEDGNAVLYPGDYTMLFDVPTALVVNFTLTGTQVILDEWPKRPSQG